MTWFAHGPQRGSPYEETYPMGQSGERRLQVHSPDPTLVSAADTSALGENHDVSEFYLHSGFPQQLQSSRGGSKMQPAPRPTGDIRSIVTLGCGGQGVGDRTGVGPREASSVQLRDGGVRSCSQHTNGRFQRRGKLNDGCGRALPKSAVLLNSALFARCCGPSRRLLTSRRLREPMSAPRGAGCQASMSRRYRLPLRSLRKSSFVPTGEVTQRALRGKA